MALARPTDLLHLASQSGLARPVSSPDTGGGSGDPEWVDEYIQDWRDEPPTDLKADVDGLYTDRFGITYDLVNRTDCDSFSLDATEGLRAVVTASGGPGLQIRPTTNVRLKDLIAVGGGPDYDPFDRCWMVWRVKNYTFVGNDNRIQFRIFMAFGGTPLGWYLELGNPPQRFRMRVYDKNGSPGGFYDVLNADTSLYIGMEFSGYSMKLRAGTVEPSVPEDLAVIYPSEAWVLEKIVNDAAGQLVSDGTVPQFNYNFAMFSPGLLSVSLESIKLRRWRTP